MKSANETALVGAIKKRLALDHDVECLRINAGMAKVDGRMIRLAPAGVSDLLLCVRCRLAVERLSHDGTYTTHSAPAFARFCALECKVGRNKPTDKQQAWLDRVTELGGHAAVVRSVEDAVREVEQCKRLS